MIAARRDSPVGQRVETLPGAWKNSGSRSAQGDQTILSVADPGPGIPPAESISQNLLLGLFLLCLTTVTLTPITVRAADPIPSRQDRELVMSAVNIGMTEAQRLEFRDAVAEFLQDYRSAMLKIARGHNATGLERKMEKKHRSLLNALDVEMAGMLTAVQYQRYSDYRERLVVKLTQRSAPDSAAYLDWEIPPANHH